MMAEHDGSITLGIKLDTSGLKTRLKASAKQDLKALRDELAAYTQGIKVAQAEYARLLAAGDTAGANRLLAEIKEDEAHVAKLRYGISALSEDAKKNFAGLAGTFKNLGKTIVAAVKRALKFTLIYQTIRLIVSALQNVVTSDKQVATDWEQLKAALYAIIQPLQNVIAPLLSKIIGMLTDAAVMVGKIIASVQGISYDELLGQAKAAKQAADAYDNMGSSAEEAQKKIAGFDDILVLSSDQTSDKSSADDSYQAFDTLAAKNKTTGEPPDIKTRLQEVVDTVAGAMLAIGVILLMCGQIPLGLGVVVAALIASNTTEIGDDGGASVKEKFDAWDGVLVVAGILAIVLGVLLCSAGQWGFGIGLIAIGVATEYSELSTHWDAIKKALDSPDVQTAIAVAGVVAITLGILLCTIQSWGLGIALIALGAAAVVTEVATHWDAIKKKLQDPKIAAAVAVVGALAIVLGILLIAAGAWGLGIGAIVVGATTVVAAVAANWESISEKLAGWLTDLKNHLWQIGAALFVVGVLLLLVPGVGWGLGLAFIIAGAAFLIADVVVNFDAIMEPIVTAFETALAWIKQYGLLVLAIILCLSVVGIPFGIALLIIWAKQNYEQVDLAKNIYDFFVDLWGKIVAFWDKHIAPIFTAGFWLDLAKKCGNGLIEGFENAINGIISLFETMINWIVHGLNKISFDVPDWVPLIGGKTFGFDLPDVSFGRVSIPRLAQGAVIPANKEFLAVLGDQKQGTNIEAPAELIKQMVVEALAEQGGAGSSEVVLEIDGREFGRAVVEQGGRENRRIGTRLVVV